MTPVALPFFDSDILARVVVPAEPTLAEASARPLLQMRFNDEDVARMSELAGKNQSGELNSSEQGELESFLRVGCFLDLVQAKALVSLREQ